MFSKRWSSKQKPDVRNYSLLWAKPNQHTKYCTYIIHILYIIMHSLHLHLFYLKQKHYAAFTRLVSRGRARLVRRIGLFFFLFKSTRRLLGVRTIWTSIRYKVSWKQALKQFNSIWFIQDRYQHRERLKKRCRFLPNFISTVARNPICSWYQRRTSGDNSLTGNIRPTLSRPPHIPVCRHYCIIQEWSCCFIIIIFYLNKMNTTVNTIKTVMGCLLFVLQFYGVVFASKRWKRLT